MSGLNTAAASAATGTGPVPGPLPPALAGVYLAGGTIPTNIAEMCTAIGLEDDARDAMLTSLGATVTTPLAGLSAITKAEVDELIANLTVGSSPPSLLEKSAIRLFFSRTAQLSAIAVPAPQPAATVVPATQPVLTGPPKKAVKHSLVTNQVDESVTELISTNEHVQYLARWQSHFGAGLRPPPEDEPTVDQLSVCIG